MTRTDISARLRKLVAEHLERDHAEVTEEKSFAHDLGADSLDMVELVLATEDEFDIEISDGEAESLKSVGDAVSLVERLLQAPAVA